MLIRHFLLGVLILPATLAAQTKKTLDHSAYDEWRSISTRLISNNGAHVAYTVTPNSMGNSDAVLVKHDGTPVMTHKRASGLTFTNNSQHLVFKVTVDFFEERELKRKKTKEANMPKDTLAIYHIPTGKMEKVSGLKSFKVPEKWDDYLVYLYEPPKDTSKAAKKHKKRDKKNGYDLVLKNLKDGSEYIFNYVLDYAIAEEGASLALVTTGNDSTVRNGVYRFDFKTKEFKPIYRAKGKYHQLNWDVQGKNFTFISDIDTTKALLRDYHLNVWIPGSDSSRRIVRNADLNDLMVNHEFKTYFSEKGSRLFFQVKEFPVLQDTTLIADEIVNVEVWHYQDDKLHTQQKVQKKEDEKFGHLSYYDLTNGRWIQLGSRNFTSVSVSDEGDGTTAIALNERPYWYQMQWEGGPIGRDLFVLNLSNGNAAEIKKDIRGNVGLSPKGKYAIWYDVRDSAWFAYSFADRKIRQLTDNKTVKFYQEIHDTPNFPSSYGTMSWTENDARVLIYDRYDIWEIDPLNPATKKRITNGRAQKLVHRYVKLDPEERFIKKNQSLILTGFYEMDKRESVMSMVYGKNQTKELLVGNFSIGNFRKARDNKNLIFTAQSFVEFPDIRSTDVSFVTNKKITDINPQQKKYNWGTIELVSWTSLDGEELQGLLVKPENFDPNKKYPLLVNFYERSSDELHSHRAPYPGRSSINYSLYASRGYVIFNPDVSYKTGYPGESAYNCVIPGVEMLIQKGFIDEKNIGLQGHSWGGYQAAYLIGKTNLFKCAEAGAPVPNMTSAYGGIRWETGLNRMFQYERTQSRIGATLWEKPELYIENSPLFFLDKVNTPVLIMHNDMDGHVPWYQGIEYFVALKRLGKTAWMLNYQGEPHWPVKVQNRIDFNIRLAQFFDHYLKGEPMPKWMRDGVPALEVGIKQGLELVD
jgi:dipeptidyl aminopeptidase/acylaminoacyl peptidase